MMILNTSTQTLLLCLFLTHLAVSICFWTSTSTLQPPIVGPFQTYVLMCVSDFDLWPRMPIFEFHDDRLNNSAY